MPPATLHSCVRTLPLIIAACAAAIYNRPACYAVLICLLCNLSILEWTASLKKNGITCHRNLLLAAGLAYPWLMAGAVLGMYSQYALQTPILQFGGKGDPSFLLFPDSSEQLHILTSFFTLSAIYLACFIATSVLWEMASPGNQNKNLSAISGTVLPFLFPAWFFSWALSALIPTGNTPSHILPPVILLLLACGLFELLAAIFNKWLGGKIFKRNPLSRHIAPERTWEGLLGATATLSIAAATALLYHWPDAWFNASSPDWTEHLLAIIKFILIFVISIPALIFGMGLLAHFGALVAIYLRQTLGIEQTENRHISTLLGSLGLPLAAASALLAAIALLDNLST